MNFFPKTVKFLKKGTPKIFRLRRAFFLKSPRSILRKSPVKVGGGVKNILHPPMTGYDSSPFGPSLNYVDIIFTTSSLFVPWHLAPLTLYCFRNSIFGILIELSSPWLRSIVAFGNHFYTLHIWRYQIIPKNH